MKINCIIIEDEPIALQKTKNYILKVPSLNLLSTFDNGIDAMVYINSNKIDLIFLDIKMPGMTGLEAAQAISHLTHIVFITAFDQYAVEAFEHGAIDYVLKPYRPAELKKKILEYAPHRIVDYV